MKRIRSLLSVCLLVCPLLVSAAPTVVANTEVPDEHAVWIKQPIHFAIPVGQQRLVVISQTGRAGEQQCSLNHRQGVGAQ